MAAWVTTLLFVLPNLLVSFALAQQSQVITESGKMNFYSKTTSTAFTGTDVKMSVDSSTGNVGIGTTTPGQKLTVSGTIESTTGGVKYPDGNTQTSAFQKTMNIRTVVHPDFFLANGGSTGRSSTCLAGEIATGGGCGDSGFKMFYQMVPSATAYTCYWYNTSGAGVTITSPMVYVNCLK